MHRRAARPPLAACCRLSCLLMVAVVMSAHTCMHAGTINYRILLAATAMCACTPLVIRVRRHQVDLVVRTGEFVCMCMCVRALIHTHARACVALLCIVCSDAARMWPGFATHAAALIHPALCVRSCNGSAYRRAG